MIETLSAEEVVRRLGGRARRRDVLEHTTRGALRGAVGDGTLVKARRGRFVLPELPEATRLAEALCGLVSHESAAQLYDLEMVTPPATVHLTVPRGARRTVPARVTLHTTDVAPEDDHGGITSPLRTVVDCALTMPFVPALAVADSALRRELFDPDQLLAAALRRKGPGRQRLLRIASHADARADNPFESALRGILLEYGLEFEPQVVIALGDEEVRVDLADVKHRIVYEADSFGFHSSRSALRRDCRRYTALACDDWRVLRASWEDVMFDPTWVGEMGRTAVRRAERTRYLPDRPTKVPLQTPQSLLRPLL